jgi:hypothetical protein
MDDQDKRPPEGRTGFRAALTRPNPLPSRAFGSVGASVARHLAEPATRARCETRGHFGTFS